MKNQLHKARSAYLRQHQDNPVWWYEWGDEALSRARRENKPIFLSIGYSSCHWCHVMEKESFSSASIAESLNENFVSIKVDREERPDLDHLYMKAIQAMTGQGGWPLNVFLTPDLRPFYGGTYFAPDRRYKRPGFNEVLDRVIRVYREQSDEVRKSADSLTNFLFQTGRYFESKKMSEQELYPKVLKNLEALYDKEFGGFGPAPKFFYTDGLKLFLWAHEQSGENFYLEAVSSTLEKMACGGVFDHLAGGFHRYSTDQAWTIPHFEKMLYDNALLTELYALAYKQSGKKFFLDVAQKTANFILKELRDPSGAFWSSMDADTEGQEGKYYLWTSAEWADIFTPEEQAQVKDLIALCGEPGAIRWRNVPSSEQWLLVNRFFLKLKEQRAQRKAPAIDKKIQSSWNGLMISGLCRLSEVSKEAGYLEAAITAADSIWDKAWTGSLLKHVVDGEELGFLEDQAFFARAQLDLFFATSEIRFFERSLQLADSLLEFFYDSKSGGFWSSPETQKDLLLRSKDVHDGAIPSDFAASISFLQSLFILTAKKEYGEAASRSIESILGSAEEQPGGFSSLALVTEQFEFEKIFVSEQSLKLKSLMHRAIKPVDHPQLSLTQGKKGKLLVCNSQSCESLSPEEIQKLISA